MLEKLIPLLGDGRFAQLKTACENILRAQPRQAVAHHALGLIHAWSGRFEDAVAHLNESLLPPYPPTPFLHLAYILHLGIRDQSSASAVLKKGIALHPNDPELKRLQSQLSTCSTAEDSKRRLAQELRDIQETARAHRIQGQHKEATQAALRGLLQSPLDAGLLEELGLCKQSQGMHTESAGCFHALTQVIPGSAEAWCHLGGALLASGDPDQAADALQAAIRFSPGWHLPFRHLAMAHLQRSRHEECLESLRHCTRLAPEDTVSLSQHLFSLNYLPNRLQGDLPTLYESAKTRFGPPVSRPPTPREFPERIKIGYVSADFSDHPVAYFLEPLFEYRDKQAFELFAYSNSARVDSTTLRLKSLCDHWREVWCLSDESLASQIRKDGIHVLVDLSGHTPGNRLKVFARRPAPIQVTMIGCMQTTGLPSMDLRVTDSFLHPNSRTPCETESLVIMENGVVVFRPPADAPEVSELPSELGAPFTFASFNDPAKVTSETLALWAKILLKTHGSELLLVKRPGCKLKQALQELGISADRIKEYAYGPLGPYLSMHGAVDLALDPFPYNGLTVTIMACWMGVPTITLTGLHPPARTAANILSRMGLQEFVCKTPESYIDTAIQMFSNREHLANVRKTLRDRTRNTWCNGLLYTQEFEKKIKVHLHDLITRQEQDQDPT